MRRRRSHVAVLAVWAAAALAFWGQTALGQNVSAFPQLLDVLTPSMPVRITSLTPALPPHIPLNVSSVV